MGDRVAAARVSFYLGRCYVVSPDLSVIDQTRAAAPLHSARATLEELPESETLGWVYMMLGTMHGYRLQAMEWTGWLERAREVADRLQLPALQANVGVLVGFSLQAQGRIAEGAATVARAWELAAERNLPFQADRARSNSAVGLLLYDPRRGRDWANRQPDFHTFPSRLELPAIRVALMARLGEFAAAEEERQRLSRALNEGGLRLPGMYAHEVARYHYLRGDWPEARHALEDALELHLRAQNLLLAARTANLLGEVCRDQHDYDSAVRHLVWSVDRCREGGAAAFQVEALLPLSGAFADLGQTDQAGVHLDEAFGLLASFDNPGAQLAAAARIEGVVRAAQGRWPEAEAAFERACAIACQYGVRWDEAKALQEWGRSGQRLAAFAPSGPEPPGHATSEERIRQAYAKWEEMGAGEYVQRCQEQSAYL